MSRRAGVRHPRDDAFGFRTGDPATARPALSTSLETLTKLGADSLMPTSDELEAWLDRAG